MNRWKLHEKGFGFDLSRVFSSCLQARSAKSILRRSIYLGYKYVLKASSIALRWFYCWKRLAKFRQNRITKVQIFSNQTFWELQARSIGEQMEGPVPWIWVFWVFPSRSGSRHGFQARSLSWFAFSISRLKGFSWEISLWLFCCGQSSVSIQTWPANLNFKQMSALGISFRFSAQTFSFKLATIWRYHIFCLLRNLGKRIHSSPKYLSWDHPKAASYWKKQCCYCRVFKSLAWFLMNRLFKEPFQISYASSFQ